VKIACPAITARHPAAVSANCYLEASLYDEAEMVGEPTSRQLTPRDPDVEAGLAVAAHAAKKFRNALRELARDGDLPRPEQEGPGRDC
jgi:hypothetical protein